MANNIFQQQITPVKPKTIESERIFVYVPTAAKNIQGIASYNDRDFGVNNGHVSLIWPEQMLIEQLANPLNNISKIKLLSDEFVNTNNSANIKNPVTGTVYNSNTAEVKLNRQMRDAFARPELVMLDDVSDFETVVGSNKYVKYVLKRNNPLEQPSLIQISTADFIRKNNIVSINWQPVNEKINIIETTLNDVISNKILIGDDKGNFATKGAVITENVTNGIAIGNRATVGALDSIAIGVGAEADGNSDIAIGENARANYGSLAVGIGSEAYNTGAAFGSDAEAHSFDSLALGNNAVVIAADSAVQIGRGTNNSPYTLKFRDYTIIDKNGKLYTNSGNSTNITMKLVASEEYVNELFGKMAGAIKLQVVDVLPTSNIDSNIIYLVPNKDKVNDYYDEYVYLNNKWELIGTTKIDLSDYYTKSQIDDLVLNGHKQIILGATGVAEDGVYNFEVDNAESFMPYKTNGTKFLMDFHLPIVGDLDVTRKIAITFGNTIYYLYNILKNEHSTAGDLRQVDKYNNQIGYRFITEITFFENPDITGFAIIPTVSMSDVLSLTSDEMDDYLADGGLNQGQLAICSKLINNGYVEGALYRYDIVYPNSYTWTILSKNYSITKLSDTDLTTDEFKGIVYLTEAQYGELIEKGFVSVNNETIFYDERVQYITPDTSYSIIQGTSAPDISTKGEVGQFYLHIVDDEHQWLYICVKKVDDTNYFWKLLSVEEALSTVEELKTIVTNLTPDVARALKLPATTPIEPKLVTVNTSNLQEMISLGDELEIKNDELKLSGKVISNPNLLINGDFRINQKGKPSYEGGNIPTVDKWYTHGRAKVDVLTDGIKVTAGRGSTSNAEDEDWTGIRYFIENPSYLSNKTVTFSFNATGSVGVWLGVYQNGTHVGGTYSTKTVNQTLSSTITFGNVVDTDEIYFRFTTRNENDTITLYWVKLEVGSVATAFCPKSYEEELTACQVAAKGMATTYSNPNILVNGDFKINQRGQSLYERYSSGGRVNIVDGWNIWSNTGSYDVSTKTLINKVTTGNVIMSQWIRDYENYYGKTLTLSGKINDAIYSMTATIPNSFADATKDYAIGIYEHKVDNVIMFYVRIAWDNTHKRLRAEVGCTPSQGSMVVEWMKLEVGPIATAFSPRSYEEELAICQNIVEGILLTNVVNLIMVVKDKL